MSLIITVIRYIAAAVAIWQILGLLPVLTWLTNPGAVTPQMWVILIFKGIILAICAGIYFLLGKTKKRSEADHERAEG